MVMENFMNKLFKSKNLLEDNKLNTKIEKIFDNKLFQLIVEKTDVLEGEDLSMTKSILNNKMLDSALLKSIAKNCSEFEDPSYQKVDLNLENKLFTKKAEPENSKAKEEIGSLFKIHKETKIKSFLNDSPEKEKSLMTITDFSNSGSDHNEILRELTSKMGKEKHEIPSEIGNNNSLRFDESFDVDSFLRLNNERDEYENDDDIGFEVYDVPISELDTVSGNLLNELDLKNKMIKESNLEKNNYLKNFKDRIKVHKDDSGYHYLPLRVKHPESNSKYFPKKVGNTIYDVFDLKIIFDRERTGFEESKEFPIVINSIIGGRYKVVEFLGAAAFSKAVHVVDIPTGNHYCLKIIENNKDYFDQSIDEIKILRYLNVNGNLDEKCILKIFECFYYKEHLFIVTELLKDNLYDYYKFNLENENEKYFTVPAIRSLALQMLEALEYIHDLHLIHCDVKPENIMIKSYSNHLFKLIDFGSSCYIHDHLSSYVQSRFYRAPEVILGCKYDYKIDLWSLGCVLVELFTGKVLFNGNDMPEVLCKICSVIGPFPDWMLKKGKNVEKYFTKDFLIFKDFKKNEEEDEDILNNQDQDCIGLLIPKKTNLKFRMNTEDSFFLDFVSKLLSIDPNKRPTAKQALQHQWFNFAKY